MTEVSARILADSFGDLPGSRLVTVEAVMHRFVLAEANTHRVWSRNSASSRAIPLARQIDRAVNDTAEPVKWAAEQKGMSGGDEVADADTAAEIWAQAVRDAAEHARGLGDLGVHKSIANRLLEPFQWHTVIITATAWENFFSLRCSPLAQPEIEAVATAIREAMADSAPARLFTGEWHLPLIQDDEHPAGGGGLDWETAKKISAARCARVSYLTHDGKRDIDADLDLYERLTTNGHSSPLEHVATPQARNAHEVVPYCYDPEGFRLPPEHVKRLWLPMYGNLLGWHQLRFDVENARYYQAFA